MIFYWALWFLYLLACGVLATAVPLSDDMKYYYHKHGTDPSKYYVFIRFVIYLPFAVFGQILSPGPLVLGVIGVVLSLVF